VNSEATSTMFAASRTSSMLRCEILKPLCPFDARLRVDLYRHSQPLVIRVGVMLL
jgi:hypothetical protein